MRDTAGSIAEIYSLGTGPWTMTPVTRGALGQIWKLSGNGSSWAVKELLFGCDEAQVRREADLRDSAERLGIASPRLHADRHGAHVSRLDSPSGGSWVKLYDWAEGTRADASDPDVVDWFGRTMALLHQAGEGAVETPDAWYERCPDDAEWEDVLKKVRDSRPALVGRAQRLHHHVRAPAGPLGHPVGVARPRHLAPRPPAPERPGRPGRAGPARLGQRGAGLGGTRVRACRPRLVGWQRGGHRIRPAARAGVPRCRGPGRHHRPGVVLDALRHRPQLRPCAGRNGRRSRGDRCATRVRG